MGLIKHLLRIGLPCLLLIIGFSCTNDEGVLPPDESILPIEIPDPVEENVVFLGGSMGMPRIRRP